eukprot:CAMPEP_0202695800 /NCGR_PEP_ID=MMETSP1385-20130828/9290_1 /ASSEMBLY_ACC=CAM_ASM_000861 /TAXON_ID=933848 /ORGANISM="Elphidium margaritaceum" /LENGTH=463 /DNA_ID=CAMNT_0049351877 /DNA_START=13 /DNA_END=1404 /DNA_ORIENTATION=+
MTATTSRKKFNRGLSTNAHQFAAAQNISERSDPSVLCLTVTTWSQRTFHEFGHLCRLLLNFGLRRIVLMIQADNYKLVCNKLISDIFNDLAFLSISRIKQPKTAILMHTLQKKHLKLHLHQIVNRFSVQCVDKDKLQCILVHADSVSPKCFSSAMPYAPFRCHNLSSWSCIENNFKNSTRHESHIFYGSLDLDGKGDSLSFSTLFAFALRTYREWVPLNGDDAKTATHAPVSNTSSQERNECIPVMYEWKTGKNIGKIVQVARHFKIATVIHILKDHKTSIYQNVSWLDTIASQCGDDANNVDALKSMLDVRIVNDVQSALQIVNDSNAKQKNDKICVMLLSPDLFLELLRIDDERSLVIMETVSLGNQTMPISLNEFVAQRRKCRQSRLRWYGIVGRENYGIKPRYLYDLYLIYKPAVAVKQTQAEKECKVVYVQTSRLQPSLNASTALSLLICANESFSGS